MTFDESRKFPATVFGDGRLVWLPAALRILLRQRLGIGRTHCDVWGLSGLELGHLGEVARADCCDVCECFNAGLAERRRLVDKAGRLSG